jgi:hypothetical protein
MRVIRSNNILYGYRDGEFFEEQIDSPEEYEAVIQQFEQMYGSLKQEKQIQDVRSLLETITGETINTED